MQKKLVFISSMASPQQVKFCYALQDYLDSEFWFYETPLRERGSFWQINLGNKCKILKKVFFLQFRPFAFKYIVFGLNRQLNEFNPDIVMLGGFSIPSNYLAFCWAKKHKKQTIVVTEISRQTETGVLRKPGFSWKLIRWLYKDVDIVMTTSEDAAIQFRDGFGFGEKVVAGRYAADLDDYFDHPVRLAKTSYTFLVANRMTEIYNPILAIEIFAKILEKYPDSKLLMNASGELSDQCTNKITELNIVNSVSFLTEIKTWDDLPKIYEKADILILPANFSNGNFTILEAMASGMGIVISNRILGIGKMIENNRNGFNVEPNVLEFVSAIENYINDPGLFEEHAKINRPLVAPLSVKGTAKFFTAMLHERLGI